MRLFIGKILMLFVLTSCFVYSQTYYMNVWSGGNVTSVAVSEISSITFADITSAVDNESMQAVIKDFVLYQNYPNPFNPATTIIYQVPASGDAEIKIFSINGELIKSMKSEHQGAGQYSVVWDGKNENGISVTSGMYIYRVTFGGSMLAKKMLLIK